MKKTIKSRRRRDFFKGKVPQKPVFLEENRPDQGAKRQQSPKKVSARKEHSGAGMFPWLACSQVREQAVSPPATSRLPRGRVFSFSVFGEFRFRISVLTFFIVMQVRSGKKSCTGTAGKGWKDRGSGNKKTPRNFQVKKNA